ncbi:MAG: ABC transporter permease subunit [Treponema sp.]
MKFYFEINQKTKKLLRKKEKLNYPLFQNEEHYFFVKRMKVLSIFILTLFLYAFSAKIANVNNIFISVLNIPKAFIALFKYFSPSANSFKHFQDIRINYFKTMLMAISSTTLASFFALIFAIFSANFPKKNHFLSIIITIFASIFRNIPLPAWVILFLFSFGQNDITGFYVLFIVTLGYLTRIFKELIDSTSIESFVALRSLGASYISAIIHGVLPNIEGKFIAWLLYTLSTNIRDSALVGILTGSGIGFLFTVFFRSFRYETAGLIILILTITVLVFDFSSEKIKEFILFGKVKESPINAKRYFSFCLVGILLILSIFALYFMKADGKSLIVSAKSLFENIYAMFVIFPPISFSFFSLLKSCIVSLALAFLTTIISVFFSLPLAILSIKILIPNSIIKNIISCFSSFVRAIPTIIWVMLFSVCLGVGPIATIIGLSLHSIAYLVYAFSMSFNSLSSNTIDSLISCGAPKLAILTQAILPSSLKQIISWTFFRFEINFMNVVALGSAAGAGGIGYELFIAGSMEFNIKAVGLISYFLLFVSLSLETISQKIKKKV